MHVAERSGCWIHGFTLLDFGRSAGWKRGWPHRRAWSIACPSGCRATYRREGRWQGTRLVSRAGTRGRWAGLPWRLSQLHAPGSFPPRASLTGHQRPLLPHACITNKIIEEPRWHMFSATDMINQEIPLVPELPQMPFDLITHNHRQELLISMAVNGAGPGFCEGGDGQAPAPARDPAELPGATSCINPQSTTPSHPSFLALSYRSF